MILADKRWRKMVPYRGNMASSHSGWEEVLARVQRAMTDVRVKPGAVEVITSSDGSEAIGSVQMLSHPGGLPPSATAHFGFIVGRNHFRSSLMYGGMITNGVPVVIDCYGSYKQMYIGKQLGGWGMLVDQAVAKMSIDMTGWGRIVNQLRDKRISKDRADLACYRAFAAGALDACKMPLLRKLRRPGAESPWQVIQALCACISLYKPMTYNPRTDCFKRNHAAIMLVRKQAAI